MTRLSFHPGIILLASLALANANLRGQESGAEGRGSGPAPRLIVAEAEPFEAQTSLFQRRDGWIGGDGVQSVALDHDRTLWLFSDTWVGSVRNGKRTGATMVNNTVAVQHGRGDAAGVRFTVGAGKDGKPAALVTPADGRGWFWLQAGVILDGRLVLFLNQIEKADDPGVFGFRPVGQWVGVVANPQDDPRQWRVEQQKLPHTVYTDERELTFGASILRVDDYLYVYGTDEDVGPQGRDRHLVLARVPAATVGDFAAWEFLDESGWQPDFRKSDRLVPGMASEFSVIYLPERRQFVLVYTERGMSERILARTAWSPAGPWSEPTTLYLCPEAEWDRRVFCYNGKAHAALSSGDELIVNYVANSFDFAHVVQDARLYWPRFVRVRLDANNRR